MKRIIYFTLIIVALISCSKDDKVAEQDSIAETAEVSFNFASFDTEVSPMTRIGQSTIGKEIKRYSLFIYDEKGTKVAEKSEENINKVKIENIKFTLPKGKYTVAVVAFNDDINNYQANNNSTLSWASVYNYNTTYTFFNDCYGCYWSNEMFTSTNYVVNDYFYKKEEFTLTANAAINIVAPRVTGRLELHIKDIVPTGNYPSKEYAYVKIRLENMPYGVKMNSGAYYSKSVQEIYLSKKQWESFSKKPIIFNAMPTSNPKITFQFSDSWADCFDPSWSSPVIKHEKVLSGFEIFENKITKLTGNIFFEADFSVEINSDFDGVIEGEF